MKKIYTLILSALLVGCSDELDKIGSTTEGAVELTGINATIETSTAGTRAANDPVYLPEHISRFRFEDGDRMTFTTIKRTEHPLSTFNYVGVEFQCNASGAWDRDKNTGYLDGKSDTEHPQRVYWSDALSRHTFIGFSLPKVEDDEEIQPIVNPFDINSNILILNMRDSIKYLYMANYAIILAAGDGKRLGFKTPKCFLKINKKPIYQYSLELFQIFSQIKQIILVVPKHYLHKVKVDSKKVKVVTGGTTRNESFELGIKAIKNIKNN